MVNKYPMVRQEKESWSLPACLHAIVKLRRPFEPEPFQAEIARSLGIERDCEGNLCGRIEEFLERYSLGCRYENPFTNMRGDGLLLEAELNHKTDVIAAYDWNGVHHRNGKPRKHFSIVLCYDFNGERMVVQDSIDSDNMIIDAISLKKFRSVIKPMEHDGYGFYMIDD